MTKTTSRKDVGVDTLLLSHCGLIFFFFFLCSQALRGHTILSKETKNQAITGNAISVSLLVVFSLNCITASFCRWLTHGNSFQQKIVCMPLNVILKRSHLHQVNISLINQGVNLAIRVVLNFSFTEIGV